MDHTQTARPLPASKRQAGLDRSLRKKYPTITLEQARELAGLDLVSARDITADSGQSYHQMEDESESKSHLTARDEGIGFFASIGYQIFPEGVGVRGVYTLADFLAIRGNRVVFVEVLSDTNIKADTIRRKRQLQSHGELCFILFSGTKRSNDSALVAAKREVQSWADVLYCRLDGYMGNRIKQTYHATISYDTTRENGIRVGLSFKQVGLKLAVSANFQTHLYENPRETLISYVVLSRSYLYEEMFLKVFQHLALKSGCEIRRTRGRPDITAFNAMRRKSGLKMIDAAGHVVASLTSEYRGPPVEESGSWRRHPSSRDLPAADIFGTFVIEALGPDGLHGLVAAMKVHGLTPCYSAAEYEQCVDHLSRQKVRSKAAS